MNQDQLKTIEKLMTQHAIAIRAMMSEIPSSQDKINFCTRASEAAFWFTEAYRTACETVPDKTKSGIQVVKNV